MPYHIICCDVNYENEQAIDDYELDDFNYFSFLKGKKYKGNIPSKVRLYIHKGDVNLPQASLMGGPLSWLIFSQRILDFTWPLIKNDVQVFDAPVYNPSDGNKIEGYKIINPIRVIDCIDWENSETAKRKDGSTSIGRIYIKENKVGNYNIFLAKGYEYRFIVSDQLAKGIAKNGFKGIAFIRCGVSK